MPAWSAGTEVLLKRSNGEWVAGLVHKVVENALVVRYSGGDKKLDKTVPFKLLEDFIKMPPPKRKQADDPPQSKTAKRAKKGKPPAPSDAKEEVKEQKRKNKAFNVTNFMPHAIELGLIRLTDDIVFKKKAECSANIVEVDGKYLIKDEQSGATFASLNQWAITMYNDKSKNVQKYSYRKRDGKFELIYSVIAKLCELKSRESSRGTKTAAEKTETLAAAAKKPCGSCSRKIDNASYVTCAAPKQHRHKNCQLQVHARCINLADATQINADHIWLCDVCFIPYMTKVEKVNIQQYIMGNLDALRAIRAEKQSLRGVLPRLLGEGPCDTFALGTDGELTALQAGISHYSYRNNKHRAWLAEVIGKPLELPAAKKAAANDVIELDDDDDEELEVDSNAKALAARIGKDHDGKLTCVPVSSLRLFAGPIEKYYKTSPSVEFKPPKNNETLFFDCLQGDRVPLNWYVYLQREEGGALSVVFWPGADKHAKAVKMCDVLDFRGAFDGEMVYMHFTVGQDVLGLAAATREVLRKRPSEKCHPSGMRVLPLSATEQGPVHLTMICHAPYHGGKEKRVQARTAIKAQYYLIETAMQARMKNAIRSAKSLGEEICWMQTETKELLGLNQTLFSYTPGSSLDKGFLTLDDYDRLKDKRFLNGECINFYLWHLQSSTYKDVCVFPTHFFTKVKKNFESLTTCASIPHLEWVTKSDNLPANFKSVLDFRALIVPINDPRRHWVLGVVTDLDKVKKGGVPTLRYYDSFNKPDTMGFKPSMAKFLAYRFAAEMGKPSASDTHWKNFAMIAKANEQSCKVPMQLNHTECGVHVLLMAALLMDEKDLSSFSPSSNWFSADTEIPALRSKMKALVHKRTNASAPELLQKLSLLDAEHEKQAK